MCRCPTFQQLTVTAAALLLSLEIYLKCVILYSINCFQSKIFLSFFAKGYATRERFLQRIRQNTPNLRKILSCDGQAF